MACVLPAELDEILEASADDLATLRGGRVLLTGASGFVGSWMAETLLRADDRWGLGLRLDLVCRRPDMIEPSVRLHPAARVVAADVTSINPAEPPDGLSGMFDAVIHTATPASAALNLERPLDMIDAIVDGTRRVLGLAEASGMIPFLFTSSGAIYGVMSTDGVNSFGEDSANGPDPLDPARAYHEAKRLAEMLCAIAVRDQRVAAKVARLFAFVGPHLPIDTHFAVGNFIRDRVAGRPITVLGDGTTVRSYLYASDMTSWLLAILCRGTPGRAYNVGSERAVDIAELAAMVASAGDGPPVPVEIMGKPGPGATVDRYVPSTQRVTEELGVVERVGLEAGLARTVGWHRRTMPGR